MLGVYGDGEFKDDFLLCFLFNFIRVCIYIMYMYMYKF